MGTEPSLRASGPGRGLVRALLGPALLACLLPFGEARCQPGPLGIGGQVGDPGGPTVRILLDDGPRTSFNALTLHATFDLDDYLLVQAHLTRDVDIPRSPIGLFAGPGIVGGRDGDDRPIGVGLIGGARFYRARFEIHFQLAPRLHLAPEVRGFLGGAVGLRYYP
jgi:hypothetical protein